MALCFFNWKIRRLSKVSLYLESFVLKHITAHIQNRYLKYLELISLKNKNMIWLKVSGNNIMEFCFRNIKPNYDNYEFANQNYLNRLKLKKIRKKSESILDSMIYYFAINTNIKLEELYFYLSKDGIDFWEKYFIYCVILSETEILKEEGISDSEKATTRAICIFTEELLEHSKFGNIEILNLRLAKIKAKIEFNLIFVEKIFQEKIR